MKLSVIICTHNPRADHLARTLAGLHGQTLPRSDWELIVVDNASTPPVVLPEPAAGFARVEREPALGQVAARLCGIAAAAGDLLVWVDDDNVLAPPYLATARDLAQRWPQLGAFGGQVHPQCAVPPRPWFAARLGRLAIREFSTETRSPRLEPATAPCGAGLCVRADVARQYRAGVLGDPARAALGHAGRTLGAGDDLDLVLTAVEMGREVGRLPTLELDHLIPAERLTLRYFARITRAQARAERALLQSGRPVVTSPAAVRAARRAHWKWSTIDTLLALLPAGKE